jgi:hypothetical protein
MSFCYESCVLSGRGLCVGLITSPDRNPTDCGASFCVIWGVGGGIPTCRHAAYSSRICPIPFIVISA